MRSTGYHYRILDEDGKVRYDSARHRVNRFSTEQEAQTIAERRLPAIKLADSSVKLLAVGEYTIKTYEV